METIYPTEQGFSSLFFVGWHRSADNEITRTGTVVVKRTYDIDSAIPTDRHVTPAEEATPIFMQDQPESLVVNGDFEDGTSEWQAGSGVSIVQVQDETDDQNHFLRVSGDAGGRVTQTIDYPKALAGQSFLLSFKARANGVTTAANVRLEAGAQSLCSISAALNTNWQSFKQVGIWPHSISAESFTVVLRMASDDTLHVDYEDVAVNTILYEHDLVADKPEGDVIVLPSQPGVPDSLDVDGDTWLQQAAVENELLAFGWERKDINPRKGNGAFPDDENAYPLPAALPAGFNNLYYNGYSRDARDEAGKTSLDYLPAEAEILLQRRGGDDYGLTLAGDRLQATYYFYSGIGPDQESRWQPRTVPMNLDTVVIEPDENRCYAVWRGVWEYDQHSEDAYRRLTVSLI